MSTSFSEADGTFRSENLLSNELYFQWVLDDLTKMARPGGVYLGVGPEQNFTYIAALKPRLVIIIDIRRGNLDLQLLYKALFELSKDRPEFVGRLFSRKRPEGLTALSSVTEIFDAYAAVQPSPELYEENIKAVWNHLTVKHGFGLSAEDRQGIEYVYTNFYRFGPDITYNSAQGNRGGNAVTYADLMKATDQNGRFRSYLATEENFAVLKDLESRNLIIPVIGDFAGPRAIRAVATYLKGVGETVSAFYLSNVENYLGGVLWDNFCRSSSTLPLDDTSTFIRSDRGLGRYNPTWASGLNLDLNPMLTWLAPCKAVETR
jgi:hypothetical protein